MVDCCIWPHIPHHPICMGQGKIVCRLVVCGVHKYMHKRYVHTYVYCMYIHMYIIYSYTYMFLAWYECCLYFPSQECVDFTYHHLIGSQCHPSNHKVHICMHIPIVN